MTLAWFRAGTAHPANPLDDTATLVAALQSIYAIDVFTAANAHDFVWKDFRAPYDLAIYELDDTPAHAFIRPYLLHYGGILRLRTRLLHDSRALLASRMIVTSDRSSAEALQEAYPDARVRVAATGVDEPFAGGAVGGTVGGAVGGEGVRGREGATEQPVVFGAIPGDRLDLVRRALARARQSGAVADLLADGPPARALQAADVIVSLPWPEAGGPQTPALAAMAAGKAVVVLETGGTAAWPALDPQTWRPRGLMTEDPIAVSIDPRDEEHSLALTIRRLAADATLRATLGEAAREWWRAHATPAHAAGDWTGILEEALRLPHTRHADGPLHADRTQHARAILSEFGVDVDFLR